MSTGTVLCPVVQSLDASDLNCTEACDPFPAVPCHVVPRPIVMWPVIPCPVPCGPVTLGLWSCDLLYRGPWSYALWSRNLLPRGRMPLWTCDQHYLFPVSDPRPLPPCHRTPPEVTTPPPEVTTPSTPSSSGVTCPPPALTARPPSETSASPATSRSGRSHFYRGAPPPSSGREAMIVFKAARQSANSRSGRRSHFYRGHFERWPPAALIRWRSADCLGQRYWRQCVPSAGIPLGISWKGVLCHLPSRGRPGIPHGNYKTICYPF